MVAGTSARESVKEMKRLKNEPLLLLVIIAIILFVGIFVIYPVVKVILFPDGGTYLELFNRPRWLTAIKNSLFMTLVSTISCTAVAFLFAYVIARLDVPCKGLFRFITLLPIVSPPFIVALSYILLFGVQGIITKGLLGLHVDIYGRLGLWIVQTVTFFPYAYSVIYGVMKGISTNLEYAAYNMGATRWQVFRDVFWPLCRPGVAGGALIAAINVLTDFGNPIMIGGDLALLPTEAYMQINGWYDMSTASVLAVALLIPAVALFLVNRFWVGRRSYVTITGKEISLNPFPVPKWVKWTLFTLTMLISLFVLLVYGTLFYGAFTKTWGYDWSFTWENLQYVFLKGEQIWNSIKYGLLASLGAALLAMVLAYIVQKKQVGLNKFPGLPGHPARCHSRYVPGHRICAGVQRRLAVPDGDGRHHGAGAAVLESAHLLQCGNSRPAADRRLGGGRGPESGGQQLPLFQGCHHSAAEGAVSLGLCAVLPAVGYLPQRGDLPLRALHHRGHHLCDGPRAERTVGRGGGVYCGTHHHRIHRAAAGPVDPGPPGHQAGTVKGGGTYGCLY